MFPRVATRARVDWASVGAYLLVAFVLAWACFAGLRALGTPLQLRATAGMFAPAAAAIAVRARRREGFGDMGLSLGRRGRVLRPYLQAYLIPLGLLAAGAVLALLVGRQHWALYDNWQAQLDALSRATRGASRADVHRLGAALLFAQLVSALTIGTAVTCIATTGEELGWRGHLLVRLLPLGEARAAFLVGIVWGLWHAPLIALDGYELGIRSWAVAPFFCLVTVPFGMLLAWLRLRSGSVWPAVLGHAVLNSAAPLVLLVLSAPASRLLGPPVGLLGVAPLWAFAAWLVLTRRLRPALADAG
jgi:membrane protease YdiL (CAAX protease family)